jgi:hypothetical protein
MGRPVAAAPTLVRAPALAQMWLAGCSWAKDRICLMMFVAPVLRA